MDECKWKEETWVVWGCHIFHSQHHCSFSWFSKRLWEAEKEFRGAAALKADTAGRHEQFKLAAPLSRRHKKQTVQSPLPESALTPGKISSREGHMFCVEPAGGHISLTRIIWREGRNSAAHLLLFSNPKPRSIALNEWRLLDGGGFADLGFSVRLANILFASLSVWEKINGAVFH